jgi:hypothetical protein
MTDPQHPLETANPATRRVPPILSRLFDCLKDDRGTAMTEYLVITTVMMPVVFWLFHPDNGIYKSARDQYDMTATLLMFPGP